VSFSHPDSSSRKQTLSFHSASAADTERLGERLAPLLRVGDCLALSGPLGSGKTRFVAGLARGLGIGHPVRSPTYTLIHEHRGRSRLLHVDLYRLDASEVTALGLEEEWDRAILAIEWAEKLPLALRTEALALAFEILGADERRIRATASGERACGVLEAWQERLEV
jgi:tRNA threonylcarbamoyladenosine biosynthesis protein TsaE